MPGGPRDTCLRTAGFLPSSLRGRGNEVRPEDQLWEEHGTATLGHGYKDTGAAEGAEETVRSWNPGAC